MDTQTLAFVAERSMQCSRRGHPQCGDPRQCEASRYEAENALQQDQAASRFDAGALLVQRQESMPSASWSTSELLNYVQNALLSQPNICPARRSISITTALARLGERDFNPDWVLRTLLGEELCRHIIITCAVVWNRIRLGELDVRDVPELHGWLNHIEADAPSPYNPDTDLNRLITRSLGGATMEAGMAWIHSASASDIAAWRVVDYLESVPDESDMTTPGGPEAMRWAFERMTRTYPQDWSATSRDWELAYLDDPAGVARRSGFSLSILEERSTTLNQIKKASAAALLNDLGDVFPGVSRQRVIELVLRELESGRSNSARNIIAAAHAERPSDQSLMSAYAFCWLPVTPQRSRAMLEALTSTATMTPSIRLVNLVASHLVEGDARSAAALINTYECEGHDGSASAWLWEPHSLLERDPDNQPRIVHTPPDQWIAAVRLMGVIAG